MGKNNKDDLDLRAVSEVEASQISERFMQLALGVQTFLNAIQRQALTNLGIGALYKDKESKPVNFSSLTNGLGSRLLYQGVATYPSLVVRKILTEKTEAPQFAIDFATTGVETTLGILPEVNSSFKTLRLMGVSITKDDLLTASKRAYAPVFIRNGLAWWAINSNTQKDSIVSKIAYGAAAGALSTPFHNITIKAIENSPGKTWDETWKAISEDVMKQPQIFFRGASFRAASIAATSFFLWPKTTEYIAEKCNNIFNLTAEKPSTSPNGASVSDKVLDEKRQKS
jgi:hypothetical protein